MARTGMTFAEIKASPRDLDYARLDATTEEDIRRYQIADGEDPDAPLPPFQTVPTLRRPGCRLAASR